MKPAFTFKELLVFGWNTFKMRPWFFIGTFLVYLIIQILLGMVQEVLPDFLSFALSMVVSTFLYLGIIAIYLKAHENPKAPSWGDYWNPAPFWRYLGASILVALIVLIGLVLLVVPGVYAAIVLSMTGFLVIDKGMNPIAALKESERITRGSRLPLLYFGLIVGILGFIGMLPAFLGLLVVAPVAMLGSVHAYKKLTDVPAIVKPVAEPSTPPPSPAP